MIKTLPLAPKEIKVSGPDRGRYNMLSNEESDRYAVTIDGTVCSVTLDIELSDSIDGYPWPDKIEVITTEAKKWISSSEINARREAIYEWIRRDDPEDERLEAIENAEMEHEAKKLARSVLSAPSRTRNRALEIIQDSGADRD